MPPFEVKKWKALSELSEDDLETIRLMNNATVPACNDLAMDMLKSILSESILVQVACDVAETQKIIGFIIAYGSGVSYSSPNYQYFQTAFGDHGFVYVDRIVVHPDYHGRGVGRQLYRQIVALTREKLCDARAKLKQEVKGELALCCEVNVLPPNPESLAFHAKLGFKELAQQETEGGTKRVSLLARHLTQESL